jgi:hypothetical protein
LRAGGRGTDLDAQGLSVRDKGEEVQKIPKDAPRDKEQGDSESSEEEDVWMARMAAAYIDSGERGMKRRREASSSSGTGQPGEVLSAWVCECVQHPHKWSVFQSKELLARFEKHRHVNILLVSMLMFFIAKFLFASRIV